jgi:DNA-directed RNA polymerase subunit beta'
LVQIDLSLFKMDLQEVTNKNIFTDVSKISDYETTEDNIMIEAKYTPDGLYSEQIFGPIRNYSCQCGKIKSKINTGVMCDECNVVCKSSSSRGTTFAKIQLPSNIYISTPIFRGILSKMFGGQAIKVLFGYKHVNDVMSSPYFYSTKSKKLLRPFTQPKKRVKDEEVEGVEDINDTDEIMDEDININDQYVDVQTTFIKDKTMFELRNVDPKVLEKLKNKGVIVEYPVYDLLSLKKLYDHLKSTSILDGYVRDPEILDYIFIDFVPVTPPNDRPLIKIQNRVNTHETALKYIEILRNKYEGILDKIISANPDAKMFGFVVYKYQKSVDELYDSLLKNNFQKKGSVMKESIVGKTVDNSQRSVIVPDPTVKPYTVHLHKESVLKMYNAEFMYFIGTKLQDSDNVSSEIFDYLDNDGDIHPENVSDSLYDEFIRFHGLENFIMLVERPPTLWKYNISGFTLGGTVKDY